MNAAHIETAPPLVVERPERRRQRGLVLRTLVIARHLVALSLGALVAAVDRTRGGERRIGLRLVAPFTPLLRLFLRKELRRATLAVHLRRRFELLGPTFVKLGQLLSLRRDLLSREICDELGHLLDDVPAIPYDDFAALIEEALGRPVPKMFAWIESRPLGSASIAQTHRAATVEGDSVIVKAVKPGIEKILRRDVRLLRLFSRPLDLVWRRYRPRRALLELSDYLLREVDLESEAAHAEIFAANFRQENDVVFPRIFHRYSCRSVLTMSFLPGRKPTLELAASLPAAERDRIVDLGASAIIGMIYRDGFFHADLHPANLLVMPGPKAGFIDLGMVGRLDESLRRTLLYYVYSLVTHDPDGAARHLTQAAEPLPGADTESFRRALAEINRRWQAASGRDGASLGYLVLASVELAGRYRMTFPLEMTLMVKALVTYESVGQLMKPHFDVAQVARRHVRGVLLDQLSPNRILHGSPEWLEALVQAPQLISGVRQLLEQTTKQSGENP
ncbi:MAG: AarF/UbiB family protein, partial [Acidobacteriota bacterium]